MPADHTKPLNLLLAATLAGCSSHAEPVAQASMKTPPMLEPARPTERATATVSLPRQVAPGTALSGRVPPGSRVTANDEVVPVDADGCIAWPVPADVAELRLRVQRPDGRVIVQRVQVGPR
ncbi:hypothetical protein [Stenotrophomonas sp. NLF4-10]|uniref:hypothetical protein n=1 Tax=Stenotrophomonas sp. NLF4-10 TaxID=2918754 RepID=UPI001EFB1F08|nr:hypothetical protein [Stenotrophomonas sp. NLF4-10]MCG8277107.1 hypothetical protein [Stenotrophomonas sp. NLF4-10]